MSFEFSDGLKHDDVRFVNPHKLIGGERDQHLGDGHAGADLPGVLVNKQQVLIRLNIQYLPQIDPHPIVTIFYKNA